MVPQKAPILKPGPFCAPTPGLEDIWQVHYSANGTKDTNPPDDFIANLEHRPTGISRSKLIGGFRMELLAD